MFAPEILAQAMRLESLGHDANAIAELCGVAAEDLRTWQLGRSNRALLLDGRIKSDCPFCYGCPLDRAAYSYLLGLYLGDGSIAKAPGNKGVERLEIACSDAWPGLIDACETAMRRVMPRLKVGRNPSIGCTDVNAYSKHWHCLFPQHGPGRKHTRKIRLEIWQVRIVAEFTEEFVRGLIHSDGCRGTNRVRRSLKDGDRWYEYPRYYFTNASDDIRGLFTDALDRLGIAWRRMNARNISVARADAVARLDAFVGPKY